MRRILRVSGLMGSASAASIGAGIVRAKLVALLAGAEGVGLFGLFQSFQGLATTLAGLGVPASGVREVALANSAGNQRRLAALRRTVLLLPLAAGIVAAVSIWLGRDIVARLLFDDPALATAAAILGLGVAALTIHLNQISWINGFRRIKLLAKLKVLGAAAGAAISVVLIWRFGLTGVAPAVAATSLAALLFSSWAWRRVGRPAAGGSSAAEDHRAAGGSLVKLGLPIMAAGLLTPATHLAVRTRVLRELGADSLGHFQAAWSLSMIYVGFVLAAMAVDYLPRLSEHAAVPERIVRLVNQQARVSLLLACPVVLAMLAAAPLVVRLLYSPAFEPASSILAWQLFGDFFKVPAWALATVFAALGRGGGHLMAEALWNVPYLALVWYGAGRWGLEFCGVAFLVSYAIYLGVLWISMRRLIGFRWSTDNLTLLAAGLAAAVGVRALAGLGTLGVVGQVAIVAAFAAHSLSAIRRGLAADDDE